MAEEKSNSDVESLNEFYKLLAYVAAVFALILYAMLLKNRRHWNIMEMAMGGIYFLLVPFANGILDTWIEGKPDSFGVYLLRLVIIAHIAPGVVVYLTRKSSDPTVEASVIIGNIMSRGALFICTLYAAMQTKVFTDDAIKLDLVILSLLLIGNLRHLSKLTTREGSLQLGSSLSIHLAIDAFVTFLYGALILGFTDMFIKVLMAKAVAKPVYMAMAKSFGCMILGGSLLSFASLCFKNPSDAMATLISKSVIYLLGILVAGLSYYNDKPLQTYGHIAIVMGVFGILAVNVLLAAVAHYTKKKAD